MKKVAVVYWSGTGNTEAMAQAVKEGCNGELIPAGQFGPEKVDAYEAIAFGCPAMGDEQLEEDEFQPMWDAVKPVLGDKPIGLFGSYSWAEGQWMQNWKEDAEASGLKILVDPVICYDQPEDDALEQCKRLGESLAE